MKENLTYCVEFRRDDNSFYQPSFHGFKDKGVAINIARKASEALHARVIEQRRRVVKVFSANK